jgi:hypothetical protein
MAEDLVLAFVYNVLNLPYGQIELFGKRLITDSI